MFITFEGIDGVGKTTQIGLLKQYFIKLGYDVITLREPGGTKVAEAIREILLSSQNSLDSVSELLLFNAARSDLVKKVITPALSKGKVVISDRFYDSTTAYQCYGRGIKPELVKYINELATSGLKPDITFYLSLSLEEALSRSDKKKPDRIENSGNKFFINVIEGFQKIADNEPERIKVIDASNNIEVTHQLIIDEIIKFFMKS